MSMKTSENEEKRLWTRTNIFLLCGMWSAMKCALVFCYCSTDFEVHRNWMAITANLPLSRWYFDETSEWTLDYPPFFAYFEALLSFFARLYDPAIVTLQSTPFMSRSTLLFQRLSVVICDIVFYLGCVFLSDSSFENIGKSKNYVDRLKFTLFGSLIMNPSLLLLDNIHFQYNSMMYGLFCIAVAFLLRAQWLKVRGKNRNKVNINAESLKSAFVFSVLLNFKHIYLYYAPALIGIFSAAFLLPINFGLVKRTLQLSLVVATPLIASFGPFLFTGGLKALSQILSRLFPFKRGLTHSYWAPNFWALYNFCDYIFYRIARITSTTSLMQPRYTTGIVDTYDHAVLPNIRPLYTHLLVLTALIPVFVLLLTKTKEKFLKALVLSAFAFFLFSWHVHEKALLLVQIPMTVLVMKDLRFLTIYVTLSMCTVYAQLPLIHANPTEDLIKYALAVFYTTFQFVGFDATFALKVKQTFSTSSQLFTFLFVVVEVYKCSLHRMLFQDTADFLPLMLTSTVCAVGVVSSYLGFLYEVFKLTIR
ncbi:putative dolichyl pyrophosphate Glc1Man9GlcNAc2 alpha-1,3-glucosyltransferase [Aphelenchoides besseyi]|nr:putative dolichyl pyrophosphate Glc1Man9GlcNAc2 alpha-1,3-glucosyltransferase [Aphelenchoides besseyi]